MGIQDYGFLEDLQLEFKDHDGTNGVFLCFWFYLNKDSTLPSTILLQKHPVATSHAPFLLLDEKKKLILYPLLTSWMEDAYATSESEFPMKKWVHVGCEVTKDLLRLYLDGEIVAEKSLTSSLNNDSVSDSSEISLPCISGKGSQLDGYLYSAELLPVVSSIKNHYVKDPPVQLSIDSSSAYEIEEDTDGVWSIVGGKCNLPTKGGQLTTL